MRISIVALVTIGSIGLYVPQAVSLEATVFVIYKHNYCHPAIKAWSAD